MKNKICKFLLTVAFCTSYIIGHSQTCSITGSNDINVNQTLTYSTSVTSGSSYFWSVTGGLTIVGSNTGSSVSIKGVTAGTGQVCVTKYKAGSVPCCECETLVIYPEPPTCPTQPTIYQGTCGGYPSVHPHWRFGLIEDSSVSGMGTYSWSATNFTFDTPTNNEYVVGRPTSAGYFTIYCTVIYNCTPSGTVTYNLSWTIHTDDCMFLEQMASVFPNPITSSAIVKFQLPEDGTVTALIKYNYGEKVAVLVANQLLKSGEHEVIISEDILPEKGNYILDIYFNNKLFSQQRVIKE